MSDVSELTRPRQRIVAALALSATAGFLLGVALWLTFPPPGFVPPMKPAGAFEIASLLGSGVALTLALAFARRPRPGDAEPEPMVTVCAWTRRVQWQGNWISFEEYLATRFNQRCTHGICDEAAERMREDMARTEMAAELRRG